MRSASRDPVEGEAALETLDGITDLWVAKGRKTVHVDLRAERPDDDELLALLLGRSGKLRAPVVRDGSVLVVGYNAEILGEVLGRPPLPRHGGAHHVSPPALAAAPSAGPRPR